MQRQRTDEVSAVLQGAVLGTPPPSESTPCETTDPAGLIARRSEEALFKFQEAFRIKETPPVDFSSRALQPLEVQLRTAAADALMAPGPLLEAAGEAIPPLGSVEPVDPARHAMVDTLERPTTPAVKASDRRMRLLYKAGVLQEGIDASVTSRASNSTEKMLAHQLGATHVAFMNMIAMLPGMEEPGQKRLPLPTDEVVRLGNAAARLMLAYTAGALALQKLKTGGTQRVVVQHQQVAVTQNGPAVVMHQARRHRRRKRGGSGQARGRGAKDAD